MGVMAKWLLSACRYIGCIILSTTGKLVVCLVNTRIENNFSRVCGSFAQNHFEIDMFRKYDLVHFSIYFHEYFLGNKYNGWNAIGSPCVL